MSDEFDDEAEERLVTLKRDEIRALEKRAKAAEEAQARAEAAERQLAFAKAGIDLTDPKLSYFVKGYEGDLDPEAIKAKAIADRFIDPPDAQQQAQASEDAAALERMADGAANGSPLPAGADAAADRVIAATDAETFWNEARASGLAN